MEKINKNLADEIASKLEKGDSVPENEGFLEENPEKLIRESPLQSIALSAFHMERSLKAMLYIMNVSADAGLSYNRDYFMAIFGGEDPELLQQREIDRLKKADEDAIGMLERIKENAYIDPLNPKKPYV